MSEKNILIGKQAADALDAEDGVHTLALAHNLVGGIAEDYRKHIGDIAGLEDIDWQFGVDNSIERIEFSKATGQIVAVVNNNKPVGISGFKKIGIHPMSQKEIYEIIHLSVLEKEEKKGYGTKLVQTAIAQIHQKNPQAGIATTVTNNDVIHLFSKMGFKEISGELMYQIKNPGEDISKFREEMEGRVKSGVKFFLLSSDQQLLPTALH